jgi:hypothetical protein
MIDSMNVRAKHDVHTSPRRWFETNIGLMYSHTTFKVTSKNCPFADSHEHVVVRQAIHTAPMNV